MCSRHPSGPPPSRRAPLPGHRVPFDPVLNQLWFDPRPRPCLFSRVQREARDAVSASRSRRAARSSRSTRRASSRRCSGTAASCRCRPPCVSCFPGLVSGLLTHDLQRVRTAALKYLAVMPSLVKYDVLHPQKPTVLRELAKTLDDPKRAVRKEAVEARCAGSKLPQELCLTVYMFQNQLVQVHWLKEDDYVQLYCNVKRKFPP